MLDVCLLGTGGMMPLPYRWLTSLMMRIGGSNILIDCGEGTQIAIKEKGWSPNPIDVICFTHYHADHISGLPGLLLSIGNSDRTDPITMIGPRGLERVVSSLRIIAPELPFDIKFLEIEGARATFSFNGYEIDAFKVSHNVTCYGYSLRVPRIGRFDADKAKELGIPLPYWSRLQKGETITDETGSYTPDMVIGPARRGLKVLYGFPSCSGNQRNGFGSGSVHMRRYVRRAGNGGESQGAQAYDFLRGCKACQKC